MKVILIGVLGCLMAVCGGAADFVLADNGRLVADVVVPDEMNGVERYASEELVHHLAKAYGTKPVVRREGELSQGEARSHIYLGATKAVRMAGIAGRVLADDEHVVAVRDGALFLFGQDEDTTYAISVPLFVCLVWASQGLD